MTNGLQFSSFSSVNDKRGPQKRTSFESVYKTEKMAENERAENCDPKKSVAHKQWNRVLDSGGDGGTLCVTADNWLFQSCI